MLSICFLNRYRATEKLSVITHFEIRQTILCKTHATPLTAHSGEEAEWGLAVPWPLCCQPSLHVNTTGSECWWNLGSGASLWGEREGAAASCDRLSYRAYLACLKPGNLLRLQRGSPGSLQGSGVRLEGSCQAAPPWCWEQPWMPRVCKQYDADTSRPCCCVGKSRLKTHMASVPPSECSNSHAEIPCAAKLMVI